MKQPNFYAAVFAIIKNEKGEILFQKRQNTGFRDGMYQLPCGHVENQETLKKAMMRELEEELGIQTQENDLTILHLAHTFSVGRDYFNTYIEVSKYTGILKNLEPEKCSEIVFKKYEDIQNDERFQYEVETLEKIFAGEKFSQKSTL